VPRPTLRSIALTGSRASLHRSAFVAIVVAALVAFVGYLLPAHREAYVPHNGHWFDLAAQDGETVFHSNFADGGPFSLFVLAGIAAVVFSLRSKRFGGGMVAGFLAAAGGILSATPVMLAHLFTRVETTYGDHIFALGELALFFVGTALFFAEPILYVVERKRIENASKPAPLPVAIATRVQS